MSTETTTAAAELDAALDAADNARNAAHDAFQAAYKAARNCTPAYRAGHAKRVERTLRAYREACAAYAAVENEACAAYAAAAAKASA